MELKNSGGFTLYSYTKPAIIKELVDNKIVLAFNAKDNFCRRGIEEQSNREKFKNALKKVFGVDLLFEATTIVEEGKNNPAKGAAYNPHAKKIANKFEGRIIQEKDRVQK